MAGCTAQSHPVGTKSFGLTCHHIIPCPIIDAKRQNRLKVGTVKPKLNVKMHTVSDDSDWKTLLEKPSCEDARDNNDWRLRIKGATG